MIPLNSFDISPPPTGGCSEGLDAFRFSFQHNFINRHHVWHHVFMVTKRDAWYFLLKRKFLLQVQILLIVI